MTKRLTFATLILWTLAILTASGAGEPGPVPEWIWADAFPRRGQSACFRRTFHLPRIPNKARVEVLADDEATVYLNGLPIVHCNSFRQWTSVKVTPGFRTGANILGIRGFNRSGPAGVAIRMRLEFSEGVQFTLVTDCRWAATTGEKEIFLKASTTGDGWWLAHGLGQPGISPWHVPSGEVEDYHQWKKALGNEAALATSTIATLPGFHVDLIRASKPGEGSWISLAFGPDGRLYVGREGKGILRMSLSKNFGAVDSVEWVDDTLEECRGLLCAHGSLYANANNSRGLYKLRDANGDDRFEEKTLLYSTAGGVGHGRNGLALGKSGEIFAIHGNNVKLPANYSSTFSPLKHFAADALLPCAWDRFMFDADSTPPSGYLAKFDPMGNKWGLHAGGMRNPYGIAVVNEVEGFTYDADNEGDLGQPWYRPSRLNHLVSGADFGFRQGSANRPDYYPEHLPALLNIGLGSPTGIKAARKGNFPYPYNDAIFVQDWAYGRIYALHLIPWGASYRAWLELFLVGRPLNVTDLAFGPDGCMYFVTGGRGTQSGLYRARFSGVENAPSEFRLGMSETDKITRKYQLELAMPQVIAGDAARSMRLELERFHVGKEAPPRRLLWSHLGSSDVFLRHAARVALENQPLESWQNEAFAASDTRVSLTALLSVARVGDAKLQLRLLRELERHSLENLSPELLLTALRVYYVSFCRMGKPASPDVDRISNRLESIYPAAFEEANRRLCELLVYLEAPGFVEKTLDLLDKASTQEDRLFYLYTLRALPGKWTAEQRRRYFIQLGKASVFDGGNMLPIALSNIRDEALSRVPDNEREELNASLTPKELTEPLPRRDFVRDWKIEDLVVHLGEIRKGRNFARGKQMFRDVACSRCHRIRDIGTSFGPELNAVGHRFAAKDLLESILTPSKDVDGKYRNSTISLHSGEIVVGRAVGGNENSIIFATDPFVPTRIRRVARTDIEKQQSSPISPMPVGLLNTLTRDEILDLLAFLQSGGDPGHPNFQP